MSIYFLQTRQVQIPCRAHDTDSGIDFFVPTDLKLVQITPSEGNISQAVDVDDDGKKFILIRPGEGALIPSGIKMIIPEGYDLVFENKSGVATKKNLMIGAKVVDCSYRGEVHLHIINCGNEDTRVYLGDKLTQGIVRKVEYMKLHQIDEDTFLGHSDTVRGTGGFGSTGT